MVLRPALILLPLLLATTSIDSLPIPFVSYYSFSGPKARTVHHVTKVAVQDTGDNANAVEEYLGGWELVSENAGVSAMQMILMPNSKVILYDALVYRVSGMKFPNPMDCLKYGHNQEDCWVHAVEYDPGTNSVRPLKLTTDTWCSSGGLDEHGTLVSTGGWDTGINATRYLQPCDTCDWKEFPGALSTVGRWYASQQILPDGRIVVLGGRATFSYEFVPPPGHVNPAQPIDLPFLRETSDPEENNLYPFVHLAPDGNLFIFANNRAILFNPTTNQVLVHYPVLPGGARNYPASGMSALLPLDLRKGEENVVAEVVVCGGGPAEASALAFKGVFIGALSSCGRIKINRPDRRWHMDKMPIERTMGDMVSLPSGEFLIVNGAKRGVSGWGLAREPIHDPVLYNHNARKGKRFKILARTQIARMYHSSTALLPDATVLVAGSNDNGGYNYTGVMYPTELRVEKFYPPYLDRALAYRRAKILSTSAGEPIVVKYGSTITIRFDIEDYLKKDAPLKVTMLSPTFTSHGYSQGQRLLVLKSGKLSQVAPSEYEITAEIPRSHALAPPGYYMLFVVNNGVPSGGVWVKIQQGM